MRRIVSLVICAVLLFSVTVFVIPTVAAAEAVLTTDKTTYYVGEPIKVSASSPNSIGKDWVGMTVKGHNNWGNLRWVYVNDMSDGYDIRKAPNTSSSKKLAPYQTFPAGEYSLYLVPDDLGLSGNEDKAFAKIDIKIIEDDSKVKVPHDLNYYLYDLNDGFAYGVVSMTLPNNHGADGVKLWWGDANGVLDGYTAIADVQIPETDGSFRFQYEMKKGTLIPPEATKIIARTYSHENGQSERMAEVSLSSEYNYTMPTAEALAEFTVVGDVHLKDDADADRFGKVLSDMVANKSDTDGLFVLGDAVDNGADPSLWAKFNNACKKATSNVYLGMGESEFRGFDSYDDAVASFADRLAAIKDADSPASNIPCYSFELNGYSFIFLGNSRFPSEDRNVTLGEEQLSWLKTKLDLNDGRPTFLFVHAALDSITDREAFIDTVESYPNAITFCGGSHKTLADQAAVADTKGVTVFNCAAISQLVASDKTALEGAQGYCVRVYADRVLILGRDFLSGEWISSAQYALHGRITPEQTDCTKLQSSINNAQAFKKEDYQSYSWEAFEKALAAAVEALDAPTQAQIDEAASALNDAISKLEPMDQIIKEPSTEKPTESSTDSTSADTDAPKESNAAQQKGCSSALGAPLALSAFVMIVGALTAKKRED